MSDRLTIFGCVMALAGGFAACSEDGPMSAQDLGYGGETSLLEDEAGRPGASAAGAGHAGASAPVGGTGIGGSRAGGTGLGGAGTAGAGRTGNQTAGGNAGGGSGGQQSAGGSSSGATGKAGTGGTGGTGGKGGSSGKAGAAGSGGQPPISDTLRTDGRRLLDACGAPLLIRGVEQVLGEQLPQGNDWAGLIDEIAATGANAVRIEPGGPAHNATVLGQVMDRLAEHRMVAFIEPRGRAWLNQPDVKAVLQKHLWHLTLDAFGEPAYDDPARMMMDWTAGVKELRGYGYKVPLVVISNQYGRDLPTALARGAEIVAADPEHNIIVGWQAYWGRGGYYQGVYGMTLTEGVQAAAAAKFPIQLGIDYRTDPGLNPNEFMDYAAVMTAAQSSGVGWLWWEWYNPYNALENSLSATGAATKLTDFGNQVVNAHPASIAKTSQGVCRPP